MWRLLTFLWTLIILIAITYPWSNFVGHAHWDAVRWIPFPRNPFSFKAWLDIATNIALFLPLGIFTALACPRHTTQITPAALLALGLSASVELYQVFCHNRIPSTLDIGSNVLGAALGALLVGYSGRLGKLEKVLSSLH